MQPMLIIVFATVAGVPLGLWLRRNLATLGYRKADEQHLPEPSPRWWVVWASVLALGTLAAAATLSGRALAYLPLLPLTLAGPWLAAVDFDVLRIPNPVLAPTAAATLLAIVGAVAATQELRTLLAPVVVVGVTTGVFAAVHFATGGGIGFGDVKLAGMVSFALAPVGAGAVWLGVLTGSVVALIWATMRKERPIPFGPWLLCGMWIAALASIPAS